MSRFVFVNSVVLECGNRRLVMSSLGGHIIETVVFGKDNLNGNWVEMPPLGSNKQYDITFVGTAELIADRLLPTMDGPDMRQVNIRRIHTILQAMIATSVNKD